MISISEEKVKLNPKKPDQINIKDNALVFEDTVYQISNISYATVRRWKRVEDQSMPLSTLLAWLFGGSLLTAVADELVTLLSGYLVILIILTLYTKRKFQKLDYIYLLVLHFDSGFEEYFESRDPKFLDEVVSVLQRKIENPSNSANYIANFVTNKVKFIKKGDYYYDRSINVDGWVQESVFNTGSARDITV